MTLPTPVETGSARVPGWAIFLTAFLLLIGAAYVAANTTGTNPDLVGPLPSTQATPDPAAQAMALIEAAGCQGCHGADLAGQGTFPSLHGVADGPVSTNLQQLGTDHPDNWDNLWINGTGTEVAGIDRGGMPTFGTTLTDDEIATIVNYLKTL
jgi:mono/diheme cytochrome c family protein